MKIGYLTPPKKKEGVRGEGYVPSLSAQEVAKRFFALWEALTPKKRKMLAALCARSVAENIKRGPFYKWAGKDVHPLTGVKVEKATTKLVESTRVSLFVPVSNSEYRVNEEEIEYIPFFPLHACEENPEEIFEREASEIALYLPRVGNPGFITPSNIDSLPWWLTEPECRVTIASLPLIVARERLPQEPDFPSAYFTPSPLFKENTFSLMDFDEVSGIIKEHLRKIEQDKKGREELQKLFTRFYELSVEPRGMPSFGFQVEKGCFLAFLAQLLHPVTLLVGDDIVYHFYLHGNIGEKSQNVKDVPKGDFEGVKTALPFAALPLYLVVLSEDETGTMGQVYDYLTKPWEEAERRAKEVEEQVLQEIDEELMEMGFTPSDMDLMPKNSKNHNSRNHQEEKEDKTELQKVNAPYSTLRSLLDSQDPLLLALPPVVNDESDEALACFFTEQQAHVFCVREFELSHFWLGHAEDIFVKSE